MLSTEKHLKRARQLIPLLSPLMHRTVHISQWVLVSEAWEACNPSWMQGSKARLGKLRETVALIPGRGTLWLWSPKPIFTTDPFPKDSSLIFQPHRALKSNLSCPDNAPPNPNFKSHSGDICKTAQFPTHFSTHSPAHPTGVWSPSELNAPKPATGASKTKGPTSSLKTCLSLHSTSTTWSKLLCLLEPLKDSSLRQGAIHKYH